MIQFLLTYGGYIIQYLAILFLILYYENKIKKIKKDNAIIKNKTDYCVKNCSYPLREFNIKTYFRGSEFETIEPKIEDYTRRVSEEVWHCYKDYLIESIYSSLWDKLVTDDRTAKDNSKDFEIRVSIPYLLPDRNNIEVKLFDGKD